MVLTQLEPLPKGTSSRGAITEPPLVIHSLLLGAPSLGLAQQYQRALIRALSFLGDAITDSDRRLPQATSGTAATLDARTEPAVPTLAVLTGGGAFEMQLHLHFGQQADEAKDYVAKAVFRCLAAGVLAVPSQLLASAQLPTNIHRRLILQWCTEPAPLPPSIDRGPCGCLSDCKCRIIAADRQRCSRCHALFFASPSSREQPWMKDQGLDSAEPSPSMVQNGASPTDISLAVQCACCLLSESKDSFKNENYLRLDHCCAQNRMSESPLDSASAKLRCLSAWLQLLVSDFFFVSSCSGFVSHDVTISKLRTK